MSTVSPPPQITGPQPYAIGSPIGTTTGAEAEGIKFSDIVRILKQRKLTIIITTIVLYLLVIIATLLIWRYAPAWTSEAIFELDPPMAGDVLLPQEAEVNTKYMEQLLQTEAAKLKGLQLMLDVVSQPEVKATAYYRWYDSNVMKAAVGLGEDDLRSAPIANTRLIRIALACRHKEEARTIVQAVVDRYRSTFVDEATSEMRERSEGLKNTLAELDNDLERKRTALKQFRSGANVPAMELRRIEARQHVVYLKNQLSDLAAAASALQSQLDSLAGIDPAQLPLTAEQQLAQTRNVQARFQETFEEVQAEERDLDRNLQVYQQMLDDEKRLGDQIGEVQLKLTEAEHAGRDPSRIRLRLRQRPQEAVEPSRPRPIPYLGGGFLLALAGGVGLAFLRELTEQVVRTPIDVARFGRLSVLGCIPLLDDEEADVDEIEHAVRLAPHSLVAEAFRRTRTNLQFSGPVESQRTLLITSPGPGDGKTAIAINLATTLAHGNLRVLLVDCNFRRPAIRSALAGTWPEGLSNVLVSQGKPQDFVTKTDLPNLDVLSSGPMPPTPAELLGSPQMRELIEQATKQYDRVILDGPPTLLISDATVLAMEVDGVVLVARAEENTRGALRRAREQLEGINARIIGAILNGVKTRPGGYFKRQYREFYDYVSEETIPAELPGPAPEPEPDTPDKS